MFNILKFYKYDLKLNFTYRMIYISHKKTATTTKKLSNKKKKKKTLETFPSNLLNIYQ